MPGTVVRLAGELPLQPDALTAAVLAESDDAGRMTLLDEALRPLAPEPAAAYLDLLAVLSRMRDRALVRVARQPGLPRRRRGDALGLRHPRR